VSEQEQPEREVYEPPQVENVPAEDGPAVTAAGGTGSDNRDDNP
jgi:hypothetical protein